MKIDKNLYDHDGAITSLIVDKLSSTIVSASTDNSIIIWFVKQHYKPFKIESAHDENINSLCLNENLLLSGSNDKKIKFWEV